MNSKKEIYLLVKSKVSALDFVKHWDVWNDNILQDGQQKPFPTPAVFFEFGPVIWEKSTTGNRDNQSGKLPEQSGSGEFTLHIVHKKIDSSSNDASELKHFDEIHQVFEAVHMTTSAFLNGPIQRVRDEQILTHGVLRDAPLSFTADLWEKPLAEDDLETVADVDIDVDAQSEKPYTAPGESIKFSIQGNEP